MLERGRTIEGGVMMLNVVRNALAMLYTTFWGSRGKKETTKNDDYGSGRPIIVLQGHRAEAYDRGQKQWLVARV